MHAVSKLRFQPLGRELSVMSNFISLTKSRTHPGEIALRNNWIRMQQGSIPQLKSVEIPTPVPELQSENPVFLRKVGTVTRDIFDPRVKKLRDAQLSRQLMRDEEITSELLENAIRIRIVSKPPADQLLSSARILETGFTKRIATAGTLLSGTLTAACLIHVISSRLWESLDNVSGFDIPIFLCGLVSLLGTVELAINWQRSSRELESYTTSNNTQ